MSENKSGTAVYFGQDAVDKFRSYLNAYLQDDAVGASYVVYRLGFYLKMSLLTMCRTEAIAGAICNDTRIVELEQYEQIVIDSGNSHGDSWVATFYPKQRITTFVDQLGFTEKNRLCMSCGGSEDAGFRNGQCNACAGHSEDNGSRSEAKVGLIANSV